MKKTFQKNVQAFGNLKRLNKVEKKEVKQIVNKTIKADDEYKQFVTALTPTIVFNAAGGVQILHLSGAAQGVADNQRSGDEIYIKSLHMRVGFNITPAAACPPYANIRMMVFQYKNSDMTPVINNMFLNSVANAGLNVTGTFSSRHIDFLSTYNVLYDKTVHLEVGVPNAANYASSGQCYKFFKVRIPLKYAKKKVQFQLGTTNTTNGLWVLFTSDQGAFTNNPQIMYDANLSFTDA